MSRRWWITAIILGSMTLAAGLWGYYADDPGRQNLLEAVSYFWLPFVALGAVVASGRRRPMAILAAVLLLDVETALLGAGPPIALPFVAAVPLIGVAVAVRLVPTSMLKLPYAAAWLASSIGVTFAVVGVLNASAAPSSVAVIPAFMFVDAVALAMLWRLDEGRLRALQATAAAESRVRDLLEGVDLVGVHIDRESRIDFINDFALEVTGWRRDEVIGADWWDTFATPDRREAARANYQAIVAGRTKMENQHESAISTKAGERLLIRWSHVTRYDPDGRVAGVASLGEDITAIRVAEDAARRGAGPLFRWTERGPKA